MVRPQPSIDENKSAKKNEESFRSSSRLQLSCPIPLQQKGNGSSGCPGELPIVCEKMERAKAPTCGSVIPATEIKWCNREMVCDEIGVGIRPKINPTIHRKDCCTPISQYMATFGDVAKRFLTREKCVFRNIIEAPPCNVCECCVPPCRGYYRKHECIKPEEYNQMALKDGKRALRDKFERYWRPCHYDDQKVRDQRLADLAGHNVGLLRRLVTQRGGEQCW